jgi:Ca-activated chloride channel homolog
VLLCGLGLSVLCNPWPTASAQGFLLEANESTRWLPRPWPEPIPTPQPTMQPMIQYGVDQLAADVSIRGQIVRAQISQTFRNHSSNAIQVRYGFPIPSDASIEQVTLLVDGQELTGKVLAADEARSIFESYVRQSRDPALVQWMGWGLFQTDVFPLPAGAQRTVTLTYSHLIERDGMQHHWRLPISAAQYGCQPSATVAATIRIQADTPIGNVYSPSHAIEIQRDTPQEVRVKLAPTSLQSASEVRLFWDLAEQPVQVSLLCHRPDPNLDGHFLLLIQPDLQSIATKVAEETKPTGKHMLFVLDKSGSMRGEKIDQLRRATRACIARLQPEDRFEIIVYDDEVRSLFGELVAADDSHRQRADAFASELLAGGSTNIEGAVARACQTLKNIEGPSYVLFMTDGQPTVGERKTAKLLTQFTTNRPDRVRWFSFGVGFDVNSRLLDAVASKAPGQVTYIAPDMSLEAPITQLFTRLASPVLNDAKLQIARDGKSHWLTSTYPSQIHDLFDGQQVLIAGKYHESGPATIELSGSYGDSPVLLRYEVNFPASTDHGLAHVERLWATRRIGAIIDQIDLYGENRELVDELVTISKRYGILTPYTAFLAEEPGMARAAQLDATKMTEAGLERLRDETGADAFAQRAFKSQLGSSSRDNGAGGSPALGGGGYGGMPSATAGAAPGAVVDAAGGGGATIASEGKASGLSGGVNGPGAGRASANLMRRIGERSFFRDGDRWIEADLSDVQLAEAKRISLFSDDYFALLQTATGDVGTVLASGLHLVLLVDGKPYEVIPAPSSEATAP